MHLTITVSYVFSHRGSNLAIVIFARTGANIKTTSIKLAKWVSAAWKKIPR